jgi:diguanylate cyclase (GGDEF)-like protein/PAS domain S-box-containing protein
MPDGAVFLTGEIFPNFLEQMLNGVAYCRVLYQDGVPIDFVYLYTNPAFHTQTGLRPLSGKRVTEIIPGIRESDPELFEIYGRVAAGGPSETFEIHLEGLQQWFSIQVFSPKLEHFVAVINVITERKELEEKLAAFATEIEDLYDHAPCGYHSLGPDGTYLRINATELAWLGCTQEEVIGKKKPFDFYTPASQELFRQSFPSFVKNGYTENLEFDLVSKDGTIKRVSLSATAIRDDQGNFLRSRTVMYDITELKKIENQLHQLTLEQHAMLDTELVGIVKLRDRYVLWKNKAMNRIFGYELGDLVGQPSRILYPDDSSYQSLGEAAYPVLKANGIYRTQLEMVRKDGEKIWVDISGVQLPGYQGESLWMLADITQLKKHEEVVERIAYHDILTGLPNRLLVSDRLNQALAQAERSKRMLAVCYLDLDGFKPINDQFGHETGDKVLIEIAHRMQASVRTNDSVGRLGGDEFVLLLTNLENVEEYQVVLQRVIEAINKPFALDENTEGEVTASIGITLFPSDSSEPDILLRHADQAMYQAKQSGRNRVCLFTPDIPEDAT